MIAHTKFSDFDAPAKIVAAINSSLKVHNVLVSYIQYL